MQPLPPTEYLIIGLIMLLQEICAPTDWRTSLAADRIALELSARQRGSSIPKAMKPLSSYIASIKPQSASKHV